jgi:hypothetical protein
MNEDYPMLSYIAGKLCKRFGHRWRYKDYSNHIKANGEPYEFKASRHCIRCHQNGYFYTEWKNQDKLPMDTKSDFHLLKSIVIDKVVYPGGRDL